MTEITVSHWTSNARVGAFGRAFLSGTPTIAFLNNGGAPILRSTDEGRTWAPIPLPTDASGLGLLLGAVNPANPNELVVFAGATIYRTFDGGSSWGSDAAPTTVSALDVDWSTRILYASFTNNPSLGHRPLDTPGAWGVGGQDPFRFAAGQRRSARGPRTACRSPRCGVCSRCCCSSSPPGCC